MKSFAIHIFIWTITFTSQVLASGRSWTLSSQYADSTCGMLWKEAREGNRGSCGLLYNVNTPARWCYMSDIHTWNLKHTLKTYNVCFTSTALVLHVSMFWHTKSGCSYHTHLKRVFSFEEREVSPPERPVESLHISGCFLFQGADLTSIQRSSLRNTIMI